MIRIATIVEGFGDVKAVPHLIGKSGALLGIAMSAPNPIRAGEWKKLRNTGVLERYLDLALSRAYDQIIVILDLDDGCAAEESEIAEARLISWNNGRQIPVYLVFLVREFEALFLACADSFSPSITDGLPNHEAFRDAKGKMSDILGRRYKETQDQETFTKKLDFDNLVRRSRSYRKLVKDLMGSSYEELDKMFPRS